MIEDLTPLQEYLDELWEEYRKMHHQHNPSDSKFALWLELKQGTVNHWKNGIRRPDLSSMIQLSQVLARKGVRDPYKIFDILGVPRLYVAHNSQLERLIRYYDHLSDELKEDIDEELKDALGETLSNGKQSP